MTPELEALARRAVACPRWRWMGGMRWIDNRPAPLEPIALRVADIRPRDGSDVPRHALPDLTDPATLGCLLALVRESWGRTAYTMYYFSVWRSCDRWALCADRDQEVDPGDGPTEAEALVAALEAAP